MKFKPVDFWGAEQRKQKKKPKKRIKCPHCGRYITRDTGVKFSGIESIWGNYTPSDGHDVSDGDYDYDEFEYYCPHCDGYLDYDIINELEELDE